ncbi:hypothetical protein L7F22_018768 [Adiantum nelumboides]|nr:hypothetical protein [Adiantum nelumboides]
MQDMVPNHLYANIGMQPEFQGTQGQFGVSQGNLGMVGFSIPPVKLTPGHQHVTDQKVQMAPTDADYLFDNLESMDKPTPYKGGQSVQFDTFCGFDERTKDFSFLEQFDKAFVRRNFTEDSKVRKAASFPDFSFLEQFDKAFVRRNFTEDSKVRRAASFPKGNASQCWNTLLIQGHAPTWNDFIQGEAPLLVTGSIVAVLSVLESYFHEGLPLTGVLTMRKSREAMSGWTIMGAVRVMAKDLIRTRHQITKFYALKSQLQGVSLRIQTLKSTQSMAEAMKGVTKAMRQMNRQMSLPAIQKIMQEFERQNERMEMTTEMMGDAIDDAMEGDEEEEETEELVNQVLDEIGIDLDSQLVSAPVASSQPANASGAKIPQASAASGDDMGIDSDLQARLDNLRKM